MNDSFEGSFAAEREPKSASLFPLSFESLKESLGRLSHDPENILRLVADARAEGAPDDLFVNVVHFNDRLLERWHHDNNDFTEDGTFHYRLGLLYGIDIAQTLSSNQTASPQLKADHPEEFDAAISFVQNSYRGLDDTKSGWIRQKERELHATGSDIVTVAYAGLHDRVRFMLEGNDIDPGINDQAMHVGMVDGLLFVDAYRQLRAGCMPEAFIDAVEHIPTYDPKRHIRKGIADLAVTYSVDSTDDIEQLITHAADIEGSRVVWRGGGSVTGRERFIQVGANEFTYAFEVQAVTKTNVKRQLGFAAIVGMVCDGVYAYIHHGQDGSILPVTTAAAVGLTWMVNAMVDNARAKKYSVPITGKE